MAQLKTQTLRNVYDISTALPVVDGDWLPSTDSKAADGRAQKKLEALDVAPAAPRPSDGYSEICRAICLLNSCALAIKKIHRAARRRQSIELQHLNDVIDALIDNFESDPNALLWALRANQRIYYLSRRSVGCTIWALAFGRSLRFERDALHELMFGAALLDIGKINVPVVIMAKAGALNESEQNFARRHVVQGVRILEAVDGLSAATIEMIRGHHERIDGSGYPFGLKGDEISLYAQIAGIIDSFDALSLSRYYAEGLSGHGALITLQKQRGEKFDPALLDNFVRSIGKFPTGTWIEFSDGRYGVICSQGPAGLGYPQVVPIADAQHQPFLAVHWLSLQEQSEARVLAPAERPHRAAAMERSLQAAIYGQGTRKL